MKPTHNKIKNKNYLQFLDEGIINTLNVDHILQALSNVRGKNIKAGRNYIIAQYYTGGRPVEVLDLMAKDITREGSFILIKMSGSKGGLPRTIRLRYALPLVKELYTYAHGCHPDMYIFHPFRSNYVKLYWGKTGKQLQRIEKTAKLRYYFTKWFKNVLEGGINPYYLRHNRLSQLSEAGAAMEDLRQFKGSKSFASITPYLHMSKQKSVSLAKKIK